MRIGTMIRFSPGMAADGRLLSRAADYARRIEAAGFPGIWVGDSLGRGRPTLDPLIELSVLAAVTERVELGISVLQLPLRHPIELAHRVQSVQALSGNRLRLGVGSGSTRADFELLGYDYDHRFGIMKRSLETMRRTWRGEAAQCRRRLVAMAGLRGRAADPDGRLAQSPLDHLRGAGVPGMDALRPVQQLGRPGARHAHLSRSRRHQCGAGQCRDRSCRPARSAGLAEVATSLVCPPDEARRRLQRMEQFGFDEVLLVSPSGVLEDIERARDLAGR